METETPEGAPTATAPSTPAIAAPAMEQQPAQPQTQKNFNSLQEARAAGVKPGELIYINGKPGRLQARQ
jgi:hypothetical protein